ncbi:coiled-coil domain-containing protein 169 isoform X2 [Hyla sarda]|uniref:coiled-coil domain-containing protein 169 isoform X2 n=1 Tax=Hyla sarda TaxID=327740 RepID=UPI0024C3AA00|nr:coiled-coil domain-containing protein 169 isoform X2 [Hyla sarda]
MRKRGEDHVTGVVLLSWERINNLPEMMERRTENYTSYRADPETERRSEELRMEARKKEMLQASISEMKHTVTDLERKLNSVEDEGNEWKTRYETQVELNKQLERQIHALQEKSEHIRGNPTDRLSSIRSYDQMPVGALNQYLKRLEEENILMENQLKDFELRIEQEAKAYYKVNDERRMYISEISQAISYGGFR